MNENSNDTTQFKSEIHNKVKNVCDRFNEAQQLSEDDLTTLLIGVLFEEEENESSKN